MTVPNPWAAPRAAVADVVDPLAGTEAAGRGARLAATIVDGIVFGAMVYLPLVPMFAMSTDSNAGVWAAGFGLLALAGLITWLSLTFVYVKRNGQTIAKKMLGIKVVRSDGSPVSLGRIFWLRNIVNGLLGLIPLYGIIDALFIFGESRQCLHDKLADTIVIAA